VAVGVQTTAALTFGLYNGRDVIDMLVDRAANAPYHSERMICVRTLLAFTDDRVWTLCLSLLGSAEEPEMLFTASEYLAREPLGPQQDGLVVHLLQNETAARARAVASLLLPGASGLGVAAQLRLSLAAMDGPEPPLLDAATTRLWLDELRGPFQTEARTLLEAQGRPAFVLLAAAWDELGDETREWLTLWGLDDYPDVVQSW
jgi:hypothetical protein